MSFFNQKDNMLDDLDDMEDSAFQEQTRYSKDIKDIVFDKRSIYSNSVKNKIDVLAVNPKNTFFYGSSTLGRLATVAGDFDIWEEFKKSDNIDKIVMGIQKIIKPFKNKKEKFFIEFKSGIFKDAVLDIGYLKNNTIIGYDKSKILKQMKGKKYLTEIKKYVVSNNKIGLSSWIELYDANRLIYTLRWEIDEVLNGRKMLPNNKFIMLADAILQKAITKIEVIFNVNGTFTAFSNFFDVGKYNGGMEEFKQSLQLNLLRMLKNKKYMKVIKRIFALEKNFSGDGKIIDSIFKFLLSDTSRLNKVSTDLKAIIEIVEVNGITPQKVTIKNELDRLIDTLASIYNVSNINIVKLDEQLNEAMNKINSVQFIKIIKKIVEYIDDLVSKESLDFLKENNLYPIPKKYLPSSTELVVQK